MLAESDRGYSGRGERAGADLLHVRDDTRAPKGGTKCSYTVAPAEKRQGSNEVFP